MIKEKDIEYLKNVCKIYSKSSYDFTVMKDFIYFFDHSNIITSVILNDIQQHFKIRCITSNIRSSIPKYIKFILKLESKIG